MGNKQLKFHPFKQNESNLDDLAAILKLFKVTKFNCSNIFTDDQHLVLTCFIYSSYSPVGFLFVVYSILFDIIPVS